MQNKKLIIILSSIISFVAIIFYYLTDDLIIPPTPLTIPQSEIIKEVHLTTQNLKNGSANGWTKNQDLIKFDHYPRVFPYPFSSLFDKYRIKMWSYYYLVSDHHIIGFSINHILNFGSALFMCYDYTNKNSAILKMTDTSTSGYSLPPFASTKNLQAQFDSARIHLSYKMLNQTHKIIKIDVPEYKFKGNFEMKTQTNHQTITHVYPLTESHDSNFGYGSKKYTIQVTGGYNIENDYFPIHRGAAMLDHGRGTPPYKTMWIWGSICAVLPDGRMIGLNIGAGDKEGINNATTDAIFLNGKIHKLGAVGIQFNNQDVLQSQWKIKNVTDAKNGSKAAIDLTFVPYRKIMSGKNYFLVKVDLMNIYGVFSGRLFLNNGEEIYIRDIPGFMERNYARW